MGCSCCPPSPTSQPNERPVDATSQHNVMSSLRGNPEVLGEGIDLTIEREPEKDDGQPKRSVQDHCSGEVQDDNNYSAPLVNTPKNACCAGNVSGSSERNNTLNILGGGCCDRPTTKILGNTATLEPDASAGNPCDKGYASRACEKSVDTSVGAHRKEVCPSNSPPSNSSDIESGVPECCRGKPAPCCDETCLDRLALGECDSESGTQQAELEAYAGSPKLGPGMSETPRRRACARHRRSIREQYATKLATLGCICRALIALGKKSCCLPQDSPTSQGEALFRGPLETNRSRVSVDSCYVASASTSRDNREGLKFRRGCASEERVVDSCSARPCCETDIAASQSCRTAITRPQLFGEACVEACCTSKTPIVTGCKITDPRIMAPDLEAQGIGVEHVVLSVSGMTCTGCETKLIRNLSAVAGVKNLKTSLILSRAEFDVDLSVLRVKDAIRYLERTTEFRYDLINSSGSSMEVIVSEDLSCFLGRPTPEGVTEMTAIGKNNVRVVFDPQVVGSRDLIEEHWAGIATLAPTRGDPALRAGRKHVYHVGYMTAASAALTVPVLVMAWAPIPKREMAYSAASLALATLVQVVIAGPFYPKALKALVFSRVIEMDLLIVLSTSAAYVFSLVSFAYLAAGNPLPTGQFFETSTLLITLIMVGRYVAALARQKAVESISIRSLQTQNAFLVDGPDSLEGREIDVRLLQYGDIFMVVPDTRVPTDGTILSGSTEVDESMLTGESCPVEKTPGFSVIAGTINCSGTLLVRTTRLPGDNTISTIATMVDAAKLSKPKMQELADKVASYFVPVIVALTVVTFAIWIAVGVNVQGKTGSQAAIQSITYAITVLIVSCPCAIGLAVPMVVVFASGIAAEQGVIFKSAGAIEAAHKTSHVVFDKTGTLTQGKLGVAAEHHLEDGESRLPLLLGLVGHSKHPVSVAVSDHLRRKGVLATTIQSVNSVTGRGMEGQLGEKTLQAGNAGWLNFPDHPTVQTVTTQGFTTFCFAIDGKLCSVFGLRDSLRDDALDVVAKLQRRSISVHVVSGDDDGPVQNIASILGIPAGNVKARSSPADKRTYVQNLLAESSGQMEPVVLFCGDGTNDAVALAQATVGVHMNAGSDIAQSAADVVLMRPALSGLITVIDTSKVAVRRIKFNFVWSFVYNTFAVFLAAGAFVKVRIPPEFAGLGELVSVLPVIIAALLLRWTKI